MVKPSYVIFDIRALWRSGLSVRVPGCQKLQWRLNPVWHRMHSCTHGNSGRKRVNNGRSDGSVSMNLPEVCSLSRLQQ